jgi:hypothetical protein
MRRGKAAPEGAAQGSHRRTGTVGRTPRSMDPGHTPASPHTQVITQSHFLSS